jgi:hydroxymethylglutaryl-CoA reductase
MCILSNLTDTRLVKAEVELFGVDPSLGEKIKEASLFSYLDPYRAATNNKGVLNGVDPILIATGNDWRAVQAGLHAFASATGQYRSITHWDYDVKSKKLFGHLISPISVGTVGGVTALHPFAKMSIKMLGIKSADDLSRICAAVGLVQNLGALRALSTVGIIEGHMKLHIKNLALSAGAEEFEAIAVQSRLEEILKATRRISLSNAIDVLTDLRRRAPVEDQNS